jgi:indole-3-glycerol phosphate synthase
MTILDSILEDKRREVAEAKEAVSPERMRSLARDAEPPREFKAALQQHAFGLIAEIKKASPSRGVLLEQFNHRSLAEEYAAGGASALSVLTDRKYFMGDGAFIRDVKQCVSIPVLRKDFIIDAYQVYESRAIGADALLLIVKALAPGTLQQLFELAMSLGMDVLVEAHTDQEVVTANALGAEIVGINNRDLSSFEVNIQTSLTLASLIHAGALAVSESGIVTRRDVEALQSAGFRAALVGEGIVTKTDRVAAIRELLAR